MDAKEMAPYKLLCSRILEQAAEDYKELKRRGVEKVETKDEGEYSTDEIAEFLHSEWCNKVVIKGANVPYDGRTILHNLKNY